MNNKNSKQKSEPPHNKNMVFLLFPVEVFPYIALFEDLVGILFHKLVSESYLREVVLFELDIVSADWKWKQRMNRNMNKETSNLSV